MFDQLIFEIQKSRDSIADLKASLMQRHGNWDPAKDARLTLFSKMINVLNSTQLGLIHIQFNLLDKRWWEGIAKQRPPDADLEIYLREFDMFIKLGCIQFAFAAIESSVRLIVRALDATACSNGTAEFKSVYAFLFARLKLQHHEPLLDLIRLIRNTIHNNGVYFHRSGADESVSYRGVGYAFQIGTPVTFVTWQFLLTLFPDLQQMMSDIVEEPQVAVIPAIVDPFAP